MVAKTRKKLNFKKYGKRKYVTVKRGRRQRCSKSRSVCKCRTTRHYCMSGG